MSSLVALLYVSQMSGSDSGSVEEIRKQSQLNNERDGVTGLLLFDGQAFCQYVEGPARAIADLLRRLQQDSRHKGMRILHYGAIAQQSFAGWRLGFAYVADEKAIKQLLMPGRGDQLAAFHTLARTSCAGK
jgi:hypothetical protein